MATTTAATCRAFATAGRFSSRLAIVLFLLCTLQTAIQGKPEAGHWYLLSGTPTDTDQRYPSVLYTVEKYGTRKLHPVRQIASGPDGVHSIHFSDRAIFVAYPHLLPTTVAVIHTDDPTREDAVDLNPKGRAVIDSRLAMSESAERGTSERL
jgi:hypothetical protein